MNWYGSQKGEGFEYALLVIGLSIATLVNGSGKYSIDSIISEGKASIKTL
jgi:putative oxidoreductase